MVTYAFTDNGIAYCWNAKTGKEMWKQRLAGPVSSSPVLAGGHIYQANEKGTCYVFKVVAGQRKVRFSMHVVVVFFSHYFILKCHWDRCWD